MKTTKTSLLILIAIITMSCSKDDNTSSVSLGALDFTATVSPDNSSVYRFENKTANKEEFYSFYKVDQTGTNIADDAKIVEYQYETEGPKRVTLTMVSGSQSKQIFKDIFVVLPPPDISAFSINPENLLVNGYLTEGDNDDFMNWTKTNGADRMTEGVVEVQVGGRALRIENPTDGEPWETQFVSDAIPTTSGQNYTASIWIKGGGNVVRFSTNPGGPGDQYAGDFAASADWTQYSWTFAANSATTVLAVDMGTTVGTFYVDAIELVEGDVALPLPSNDSLILNGDFEEGDNDEFMNWTKTNGSDRLTQEASDLLSGGRALRVENSSDGEPWETQFVTDGFDTVSGESYTASMWIKGGGNVVRFSTNPGGPGDQYAGDYTATSDWSKYSWTFTANSATTSLALDMGTTVGSFVVDAVKVVAD